MDSSAAVLVVILIVTSLALLLTPAALLASAVPYRELKALQSSIYCVFAQDIFIERCVIDGVVH